MKRLLIYACVLFIMSCSDEVQNSTESMIPIEINIEKLNYSRDSLILIDYLLRLDTINQALLADVSKVFKSKDCIFILDKKQNIVVQFDLNGKYLRKLDKRGKGPEEYLAICDIFIDEASRSYYILDNRKKIILHYNYNNEFLSSVSYKTLPFAAVHGFSFLEKDIVAFYANYEDNHVVVYDLSNQEVLCISNPVPEIFKESILPLDFVYSNIFSLDHKLYYFECWDQIIYEITKNEIIPAFILDFKNVNFINVKNLVGGRDYRQNFYDWYNGDWIRGLDCVTAIDNNLIIEFSYKNKFFTSVYNGDDKKAVCFLNKHKKYSDSNYKHRYIGDGKGICYAFNMIKQEQILSSLEEDFDLEESYISDNYYILGLCLKK